MLKQLKDRSGGYNNYISIYGLYLYMIFWITNLDLAMVLCLYPDWWRDMSVSGLQEVKHLLLNQQIELKRNGHPVLYRNLLTSAQKKQQNPS